MGGLKSRIPDAAAMSASALFLTLAFFVKLAISQYSDIELGYFLLAALICLLQISSGRKSFILLAGIYCGFLSFTKPEGMIAALILMTLALLYFVWTIPGYKKEKVIPTFLLAAGIAFLPTILFHILYSPGNQTFINGLTSKDHPANFFRFKFIWAFLYEELKSGKWHGIWILLGLGALAGCRRGFRRQAAIIPFFLLSYLAVILVYYFLNTYFKIEWWMQVTLNRILFSLLPTVVFWVFDSLWEGKKTAK
jgi:hypothetical protein